MIWFTSDQHFGHANIIKFCRRPFDDVDHMREGIANAWNDIVAPDDLVYVVGDYAMGKLPGTLEVTRRLNGTKFLVAGNHDKVFVDRSKREKWMPIYTDAGFTVADSGVVFVGDEQVLINHFPYNGDSRDEDRFVKHRPKDGGGWLIHGHVHEKWRVRGRQINVGIDAWAGAPVSFDQIAEVIAGGPDQVLDVLPWAVEEQA